MKEYSSSEMLAKLISFDTTSWKSNLELIDFVTDYLNGHGVASQVFYNEEKTKANLLATIGPKEVPGIILSGHTDVVPVAEQNWSHDPFEMIEKDGRLYGRGTCDMKGFIACALAAVPVFVQANLAEPLHLAFSYDEETGCTGVMSLVEHVQAMRVRPRACIVGEPTSMRVVNSHKGISHRLTRVYGVESHSSTDMGINAVMYAAEMISFLGKVAHELTTRTPVIDGFDPPYTTVHVGRVKGGTAANITPSYCEFEWDIRPLPGGEAEEVQARFEAYIADHILPSMQGRAAADVKNKIGVETEILSNVPPLLPQTGSSAETLVLALANQNDIHVVSYGTEAGLFQATGGVPTVVCGPGSILQAHRPDEYIATTEMTACDDFLGRLLNVIRVQD
ncbi:MAG: acetylornithine deacetylase [Emcibacter sp.]|nr:acetylornithine deacetylase [Emcibacter sp.]MBL4894354.1 acetylornithine deacetylase [Emcibacter sp.]